jgi:hypothetical protein
MPAPSIQLKVIEIRDAELQRHIVQVARAAGKTVKEETRTVFKGMVRDAIIYTPPASQGARGKSAQRQGEAAISRDLKRMGFAPIQLKGYRTITQAFGRPIKPVRVKTKENPKFAEPDVFHLARLAAKSGGKVSRGRAQAFYVSKARFNAMVRRLYAEVGRLASGWINAANQLGVPVAAWISRHGGGRGSNIDIQETDERITMRVVNHFPDTAESEAAEMIRRIATLKTYAIGRLKRQLPFLLKRAVH